MPTRPPEGSGSYPILELDKLSLDILSGPSSLSLMDTDAHCELVHMLVEENYIPEVAIEIEEAQIRSKLLERADDIRSGLYFLDNLKPLKLSEHLRSPGTYYEYLLGKIRMAAQVDRMFYACQEGSPVAMTGYDSMGPVMQDGRELMNFGHAATLSSLQGRGISKHLMKLAWEQFSQEFPGKKPPVILGSPKAFLIDKKVAEGWTPLNLDNVGDFFTADFAKSLVNAIDCEWFFALSDPELTTPR